MHKEIALGFDNCVDYEIEWDSSVIESLIHKHAITSRELTTDARILCERDLVVSILGFLRSESGGERFVAASGVIEQFAQHFHKSVTLGGTCVRAAIAMRHLGVKAAIHLVTVNDHVRRLLPEGCSYVCSSDQDGMYPHLIIQFRENTVVRAGDIDIRTSRSNRIIYDHDKHVINLEINERLIDLAPNAKVLLVSGFNAMHDPQLLAERLKTVSCMISRLPKETVVFCEDACYHTAALGRQMRDALIDKIDIYSLNEDELQNHLGRTLGLLDPAAMKRALEEIHAMIPAPHIVLHTKYWALAHGGNAASLRDALEGGITMATTRFRLGDNFTEQDYHETAKLPAEQEGAAFADAIQALLGSRVCCLPSLAAKASKAAIGLGDAFVGGFLPALR